MIYLKSLAVPAGVTLDMTDLKDDAVIIFSGTTTFAYVSSLLLLHNSVLHSNFVNDEQSLTRPQSEWEGPLFAVSGTGIKVSGGGTAILDGKGASYWDGEGGSGGVTKPKFFQAHDIGKSLRTHFTRCYANASTDGGLIEQITILNPPVQVFSINGCTDTEFAYITIDGSAGDSEGKNTDGFDIGASDGITIEYATVYNQDDCVAINSGTNIIFRNGYCSGGHGLSIGSVGGRDDNVVDGVSFLTTTVTKSVQAIRVKAISGDTGSIANVEYDDITMSSISKYGILIEQNYDGGDLDGTATSGIPITGLIIKNIVGTGAVASTGYDVSPLNLHLGDCLLTRYRL